MTYVLTPVAAALMAGLCLISATADAGDISLQSGFGNGHSAGPRNPVLNADLRTGALAATARMRRDDDDDDDDDDDAEERRERAAYLRQRNAARAKAAAQAKAAAEAKAAAAARARAQSKAKAATRQAERQLTRQESAPPAQPVPPPPPPAPSTTAAVPSVTPVAAPARPRRTPSGACKRFVPGAGITMSVPCEE
jgi:hypothetical protein